MPNRATPQQIMGVLRGQVKEAELAWTGFRDWLAEQPPGTVERQDALDYIAQNQVKLEETVYGGGEQNYRPYDLNIREGHSEEYPSDEDDPWGGPMKATDYVVSVPGREGTELTYNHIYDPNAGTHELYRYEPDGDTAMLGTHYDWGDVESAMMEDAASRLSKQTTAEGTEGPARWAEHTLVGPHEEYRELLLSASPRPASTEGWSAVETDRPGSYQVSDANGEVVYPYIAGYDSQDAVQRAGLATTGPTYESSHWEGVPNVVAHIRFSTRQTADGQPIFFIEEIQSDWHQAGRRFGYTDPASDLNTEDRQLSRERRRLQDQVDQVRNIHPEVLAATAAHRQAFEGWQAASDAYQQARWEGADAERLEQLRTEMQTADRGQIHAGDAVSNVRMRLTNPLQEQIITIDRQLEDLNRQLARQVPQGPWSDVREWAGLAFRRAVRWAAEHGFDRVGWTTGGQQNAMNQLSQVADEVTYTPEPANPSQGMLVAYRSGNEVFHRRVTPDALPEYIGKDLAEQLLAVKPEPTEEGMTRRLEVETGAEVGGKGMRQFYDSLLPSIANKLGRPFGAQVSDQQITGEYGAPLYDLLRADGTVAVTYNTQEAAEAARDRATFQEGLTVQRRTGDSDVVHALPITPEMKQSVLTVGQPLFEEGAVPDMPMTEPQDVERAHSSALAPPSGTDPSKVVLYDHRGNPLLFAIGDPEGLPDDDPYIRLDPADLEQMDQYTAENEIDFPDDPPLTDSVADLGPLLGPPPPPGVREYTRNTFPAWAHKMLDLGELAPNLEDNSNAEIMDVHQTIMNGPNRQHFTDADIDALRSAILHQWNRLVDAAARAPTRGTPTDVALAAARTLDQARRYTALMGLATVPKANWEILESVWKSAPVSQGEGATLAEFLTSHKVWMQAEGGEEASKQAAIKRAEQLLASGSPRMWGPRGQTRNRRVVDAANAINQAVTGGQTQDLVDQTTSPSQAAGGERVRRGPVSPSGIAFAMTHGTNLDISRIEALRAMTYNNMLSGPRGIQVDYYSDLGQLLLNFAVDVMSPEQGGFNLATRYHISNAERLGVAQFLPLAGSRIASTILEGVDDLQAESAGTPYRMTEKLRIRERIGEQRLTELRARAARLQRNGQHDEAAKALREAQAAGRALGVTIGKNVLAIGYAEMAGRLKSIADVSIRTLSWGQAQHRQAARLAATEGRFPIGSKEWYQRVLDAAQGIDVDPDVFAEMTARSNREAEHTVFQGQMGTVGRGMEVIQRHPLGSVFLPFLRALYHIRGWAVDLSPLGLAVTTGDVLRSNIPVDRGPIAAMRAQSKWTGLPAVASIAGGPYEQGYRGSTVGPGVAPLDRRLMYNVLGSAAWVSMLSAAFAGAVSGPGPPDKPTDFEGDDTLPDFKALDLRNTLYASGWRPYSVRVFGPNGKAYWVGYANWGPFAYMLSAAAAVAESQRYGLKAPTRDPGILGGLGELWNEGDADTLRTMGRRFFGVAHDQTYLQNFFDFYTLAKHGGGLLFGTGGPEGEGPNAQKGRERRWRQEVGAYAGNLVTRLIPGSSLQLALAQSQDPYDRATQYGSIRQLIASRLALPIEGLPSYIGPPPGLDSVTAEPGLGSESGRRQGLPVRVDALGRPQANISSGAYAFLPFMASPEDRSNPVVNALVDAGVGVPSPPSELTTPVPDPGFRPVTMRVMITPAMRQQVAISQGQAIEARVTQLLAEVPEAQRQADPQAWHDRLAGEIALISKQVRSDYSKSEEVREAWLKPLMRDPNRMRQFDPKGLNADEPADGATATPTPTGGPARAVPPSIGPPTATPEPPPSNSTIRSRGGEAPTTPAASTPVPAAAPVVPAPSNSTIRSRNETVPPTTAPVLTPSRVPATATPGATPRPAAPTPLPIVPTPVPSGPGSTIRNR